MVEVSKEENVTVLRSVAVESGESFAEYVALLAALGFALYLVFMVLNVVVQSVL